jgi:hypothetical protein
VIDAAFLRRLEGRIVVAILIPKRCRRHSGCVTMKACSVSAWRASSAEGIGRLGDSVWYQRFAACHGLAVIAIIVRWSYSFGVTASQTASGRGGEPRFGH